MTISQVITPLPPAPNPSTDTPAVFSEKAAASVLAQMGLPTEINTWSTQANAMVAEANAAAALAMQSGDLVTQAQAAANFKGNYSALTGALNMPASVAAFGDFWALNTNLANVTTDVPGTSSKWTRLRNGPGGCTQTTTAGGVILTNMSARVQSIAITAADQVVSLPSAFGITTGGEIFFIDNAGTIPFAVRDSIGSLMIVLEPGQGAMFYLLNNTTAAGTWSVRLSQNSLSHTIFQATGVNVNAEATQSLSLTTLSSNSVLLAFRVITQAWGTVLTITGNTISAGPIYNLGFVGAGPIAVTALTASSCIMAATPQSGTAFVNARHLDVAGTVITPGSVQSVNAADVFSMSIVPVSSTQAVVQYALSGAGGLCANVLTLTGPSVGVGLQTVVRTGLMTEQDLCTISGTQVLSASGATSGVQAQVLTLSGTNLSSGTALTLNADNVAVALMNYSGSQALILYRPSSFESLSTRVLTVSGTAVTAGAVNSQRVYALPGSTPWTRPSFARLSSNRIMSLFTVPGVGTGAGVSQNQHAQLFNVVDGEVKEGKASALKSSFGSFFSITHLSSTKALAAYTQASGYVQVRILEIAT